MSGFADNLANGVDDQHGLLRNQVRRQPRDKAASFPNLDIAAAAFLKSLKLLQPRAAVGKICEVKRGNVTPPRLYFGRRNRYTID